ncbi:mixed lineage kinase domain-like protein isoform X2 [Heterodontus francisci]|uniref:mixed lineage kinase domain-like protein isoform X2 n=1 Tax=Heterodontus francisci TaxID=7792 RepID=UPI00355B09CA
MEHIPRIITLATDIYAHLRKVKMNKNQCQRLHSRIEMLMVSVKMMQDVMFLEKHNVNKLLRELEVTLQNAEGLVKSFTSWGTIKKVLSASDIREKFEHINDRLSDAAQQLILVLHVSISQTESTFKKETQKLEDREDRQQDEESLKKASKEEKEDLFDEYDCSANSPIKKSLEEMTAEIKEIKAMMISSADKKAASHSPVDKVREINMNELQKDSKPFLRTDTCAYYKGLFLKQPVAIKRFISESANVKKVQKIFLREAKTMNQFRSDNILRIYGICMSEEVCKSIFLIVMEYCEHGTLKEVLGGEMPLPWPTRVRMSLDAARGVYWLHQSEEKASLHCCVSSTSFLVNEDYRVKLAGLELTKTETSIRCNKSSKTEPALGIQYLSPEQLSDVNYQYNKNCEVYSLGIVLWEISSCKTPFKDIHRMVCKDKFREPLPDDCPQDLVELIDECRAFEPFERPSAGAVVDRLLQIQVQVSIGSTEQDSVTAAGSSIRSH